MTDEKLIEGISIAHGIPKGDLMQEYARIKNDAELSAFFNSLDILTWQLDDISKRGNLSDTLKCINAGITMLICRINEKDRDMFMRDLLSRLRFQESRIPLVERLEKT